MLEDTIRFQFDPTGKAINLITKRFCKEYFQTFKQEFKFCSYTKNYQ